ncbi:MAG: hypothetical protein AAF938_02355 [Myxococcota bacterium]
MARAHRASILALTVALSACAADATRVIITLEADEAIGSSRSQLQWLEVVVDRGVGAEGRDAPECITEPCSSLLERPSFPRRVIVDSTGVAESLSVIARWYDADRVLRGEVRGEFPFVPGETAEATLRFREACVDRVCLRGSCDEPGTCEGTCWRTEDGMAENAERCGPCEQCGPSGCEPVADGTPCEACDGTHVCLEGACTGPEINALDVSGRATCTYRREGPPGLETTFCWGDEDFVAAVEGGINDLTSLDLGVDHRCSTDSVNRVRCQGGNRWGQLGTGTATCEPRPSSRCEVPGGERAVPFFEDPPAGRTVTVDRLDGRRWVRAVAGEFVSCASDAEEGDGASDPLGHVYCWGYQLDTRGGVLRPQSPCPGSCPPYEFGTSDPVRLNLEGASGDDAEPLVVRSNTLAYGEQTGCALVDGFRLACWGWNFTWVLGVRGETRQQDGWAATTITDIPGESPARSVEIGIAHVCVLTESGAAYCRGSQEGGRLGHLDSADQSSSGQPTESFQRVGPGLDLRFTQIALGAKHGCGIVRDGEERQLWCWGASDGLSVSPAAYPALGQYRVNAASAPLRVGEATDWERVVSYDQHVCAVRNDAVYCWGNNADGQVDPRLSQTSVVRPHLVCPAP